MQVALKKYLVKLIYCTSLEWALLSVSLLPFFLISFFNQPAGDDFGDARSCLVNGFFDYQKLLYNSWSGRYTSNLAYAIGYQIRDLQSWLWFLKLMPIIWMLSLIGAAFFALSQLLPNLRRSVVLRLALWGVLLLLCGMPFLASAVYWYNGAAVYTLGTILTLLLIGAGARAMAAPGAKARWTWGLPAAGVIIGLLGCNELYIGGLAGGIGVAMVLGHPRTRRLLLVWLLALLVGGAASVLAPGNFIRGGDGGADAWQFSGSWAVAVAAKDVYLTATYMAGWCNNALLWLATLLFLPVARRIHGGARAVGAVEPRVVPPAAFWLVIITLGGIILSVGLLPLWFVNDIQQRVWNHTYFLFLLTWFLGVLYAVGRFRPWLNKLPPVRPAVTGGVRVLFFALLLAGNKSPVNRAYIDLAFRARDYERACLLRYGKLQQARRAGQKTVALPPLFERQHKYPLTIFLDELQTQPENIMNSGLAAYFQLDSVYLAHPPRPLGRVAEYQ